MIQSALPSVVRSMTAGRDCRLDAAPFLLGALEPEEAAAYVRHLEGCALCRDEVAALEPVLDVLPSAAPAHRAPRAVRRRVLRAARAEPKTATIHRPRPVRPVIPSAGWLALGLTVAAAMFVQLGTTRPRERVIGATVGQAELRLSHGHGELAVERLAPLPASRTYELWTETAARRPAPSTLFAVTKQGTADIAVPGDLHGVTHLLVTVEPRGGSVVPTTRPVIQLPLAYVSRT